MTRGAFALASVATVASRPPVIIDGKRVEPGEVEAVLYLAFYNVSRSSNQTSRWLLKREQMLKRFGADRGKRPWEYDRADWSAYAAKRLDAGIDSDTVRAEQSVISAFMDMLTDPSLPYGENLETWYGRRPMQIVNPENRIRHHERSDDHRRRAATKTEIQAIANAMIVELENTSAAGGSEYHVVYRDLVAFLMIYAYGVRPNEACHIAASDFAPSVTDPERHGPFGTLRVRFGKRVKGGRYRQRTVLLLREFSFIVPYLRDYIRDVRPAFASKVGDALFVTNHGTRMRPDYLARRFAAARKAAGVSDEITPHCLRHSNSTFAQMGGATRLLVSANLGHDYAGSTATYTHFEDEDMIDELDDAQRRLLERR